MLRTSYKLAAAAIVGLAVAGGLWVLLEDREGFETQVASLENEVSRELKGWELIGAGALIVDVRTPEEFASGHIDGAILVPFDQIESQLTAFGDDQTRQIVVYCRSGRRAGLAETALAEAGFTNVFNAGGYAPLMSMKPEDDER